MIMDHCTMSGVEKQLKYEALFSLTCILADLRHI